MNDTPNTHIYTLSLHDALPIWSFPSAVAAIRKGYRGRIGPGDVFMLNDPYGWGGIHLPDIYVRSEEHTSELQSQFHLVCRLLLEKKNQQSERTTSID